MEYGRPVARIKGFLNIDIRTMQILTTTDGVPTYFIRRFTILGGSLDPYVLPHSIDNTPNGSYDIPPYEAHNWVTRLAELHNLRRATNRLVSDVTKCLTLDQYRECNRVTISVFRLRGGRLIATETNRAIFLERLHPSFNANVTLSEGAFLRSAIYLLRETPSYAALADAVDKHLRTSHYDTWLITELIAMDRLGVPSRDEDSLAFIEAVENERLTEQYDEDEVQLNKAIKLARSKLEHATNLATNHAEYLFKGKRRRTESSSSESGSN